MSSQGGSLLKLIFYNFDVIALPIASLAYPVYASITAIESKSPDDDRQWLTYWVLHSLIALFELTFAKVIEWIPIWTYAKLILICWLVIPYFSGAAYVYEHFVRPFLFEQRKVDIWYVPRKKDVFSKTDAVLASAEEYIREHGADQFKKLFNNEAGNTVHYGGKDETIVEEPHYAHFNDYHY